MTFNIAEGGLLYQTSRRIGLLELSVKLCCCMNNLHRLAVHIVENDFVTSVPNLITKKENFRI